MLEPRRRDGGLTEGSRWFRDGGGGGGGVLSRFVLCLHGDQKSNAPLPHPHQQAEQVHSSQGQDGEYSP